MKIKIKSVVELCIATLVGTVLIVVFMFIYFYIKVQFFPYEPTYPNVNIEQTIYYKSY